MKVCPNCHNAVDDNITFCPNCGANVGAQQPQRPQQPQQPQRPQQQYQQPQQQYAQQQYQQQYQQQRPQYANVPDPYDHTSQFTAEDVSANKLLAMLVYVLGAVGIVIALLAGKDSAFAKFHARQGMKIVLLETICTLATTFLVWTFIVPLAGAVCTVILLVVRIICFCQVCSGKSVEPPIVRSFTFLK